MIFVNNISDACRANHVSRMNNSAGAVVVRGDG